MTGAIGTRHPVQLLTEVICKYCKDNRTHRIDAPCDDGVYRYLPEMVTINAEKEKIAQRIVADWLIDLWLSQPAWMNRMPERDEVNKLINKIAEKL